MTDETQVDTQPERNARTVRQGVVESVKMDKTIVVRVTRRVRHPLYERFIKKSTKLHVHDETNDAREGDVVRVMGTRPLSKLKRWRLLEVVERAK
ncbi:MAG TPA: 30S ribosomal protein S17 [Candidatus Krumholzibacteria bacterium]|jgi:small subunit ribosomal protein S17|nr:30S ribosomal protein S17 [Candidatus Krumholzibacteria bacterium]